MKATALIPFLTLLCFLTASGQVTVWPGDANNNGISNNVDLLYLGLAHGAMGPIRDTLGNISWNPAQNSPIWQQSTLNGAEYAYIDCDGSGFIDNQDLLAIEQNYDLTHGLVVPDSVPAAFPNSPTLSLDFSIDSINLSGDTNILANIILGDSLFLLDSIYGLSFVVEYDTNLIDSAFSMLQGGFLTAGSPVLTIQKFKPGRLEMAITRTNHVNAFGAGAIGSIGIVMDDNLRISQFFAAGLSISEVIAFTAAGHYTPLKPVGDTLQVNFPLTSVGIPDPISNLHIFPTPAHSWLAIQAPGHINEVFLNDLTGKRQAIAVKKSSFEALLDLRTIPAGVYVLSIRTNDAWLRKKVLVQ